VSLEGIFLNGVYQGVLRDISNVQHVIPEQILYLQPYSSKRIVKIADKPPSTDSPVRLFLSLTEDLPTVHYTCEIVAWHDKRELTGRKREFIETIIRSFEPTENGVYPIQHDTECVNLLSVWRMRELSKPFSVADLVKDNGEPVSTKRETAGGWTYVKYPTQEWLESHF